MIKNITCGIIKPDAIKNKALDLSNTNALKSQKERFSGLNQ